MAFPVELARTAAGELVNVLRDTKENVESGDPVWLRDGTPDSLIGKLAQATERRACRKWASAVGQNPGTDAVMDRMCKPYLEDIGQYPGEPSATSPFTGGQCAGANYDVDYERVFDPTDIRQNTARDVQGPVTGIVCVQGSELVGANPNAQYLGITSPNAPFTSSRFQFPDGTWLRWVQAGASVCDSLEDFYITGITRTDGPDDCGDPPPQYEPPSPRPDPGPPSPITIAPDFDVDIDVEFFPDGTFNVTFDFTGGDEPVTVPVDPNPEGRDPGEGTPDNPEDTGEGGEAEGEADEGEELVGILCEILSYPQGANVTFSPAGPLFRGAYYPYIGLENKLDLQPEGSIVRNTQFFFAPTTSTHWRVSANPGYDVRVTPYYRPVNQA